MKKYLLQKLSDLFKPKEFNGIDLYEVLDAMKDESIRKAWLYEIGQEILRINQAVDKNLVTGNPFAMTDLSARRRALQFVLETALSAKREVERGRGHNQGFDLDDLTATPLVK